jgi:putative peptidoglycan lipid II flippase
MSALLTWVLAILVPIGLVVGLAAPLIIGLFADAKTTPHELAAAAGMLRIFAVQIPLYGIGIVLTGVLQAHRRFTWPALAPLLSSITVIGAYVLFALVDGATPGLAGASPQGLAILAYGTTLGVVVLSGCLVLPVRALRLPLRPRWSFDDPGQVRALALAGAVTVLAQQLTLMLALKLALAGPVGTATRFTLAQTVYLLPWAVLAVPMAVAAYPTLAQAHVTGDETGYRATLARTARTVAMLSCLGAAPLIGVAAPAARFLLGTAGGADASDGARALAEGIAAFAPGLVGYGLAAVLTRALYARHRQREGAIATLAGWGVAALAMLVLAWVMPDSLRLVAIGVGSSVGMLVLAAILILQNRPLPGLWRALLAGTVAGAVGAGAGLATVAATGGLPSSGRAIVVGVLAALATAAGFLAVALPLDAGDLRTMVSRVTGRLGRAGGGG